MLNEKTQSKRVMGFSAKFFDLYEEKDFLCNESVEYRVLRLITSYTIMMVKKIILLMVIIIGMSQTVNAQKGHNWDVGISAELGKDYFDRRYASYYDQFPDMVRIFKSNYSWGAGIWAEKQFNRSLSGLVRANYMQSDMQPDIYGEPGRAGGKLLLREKHQHIITDFGGRWYVNPNSRIKVFLDLKVGVNTLTAIDIHYQDDGKFTIKDIYGYNRWQPLALAALGVNWKRVGLCVEYNRDLRRAEKSDNETTILRQGLSVKASVAIVQF